MSRFQLREIRVDNYRCFEELRLSHSRKTPPSSSPRTAAERPRCSRPSRWASPCSTTGAPRTLKVHSQGAIPPCTHSTRRGDGSRSVSARSHGPPRWAKPNPSHGRRQTQPASGRRKNPTSDQFIEAMEQVWVPGDRWPLFGWYGVDRLGRQRGRRRKIERTGDRWEAYDSSLDPNPR